MIIVINDVYRDALDCIKLNFPCWRIESKYLSFAQMNGNMLPGEKGSQAVG